MDNGILLQLTLLASVIGNMVLALALATATRRKVLRAASMPRPVAVPDLPGTSDGGDSGSRRGRILTMHRRGMSAPDVARLSGCATGEVELVLRMAKLEQGRDASARQSVGIELNAERGLYALPGMCEFPRDAGSQSSRY